MLFCLIISTVFQNKVFCILLSTFWIIESFGGMALWDGLRIKFIRKCANKTQMCFENPQHILEVILRLKFLNLPLSSPAMWGWKNGQGFVRAYLDSQSHVETYKAKSRDKKTNNYRNICLHVKGSQKRPWGFMPYMVLFARGWEYSLILWGTSRKSCWKQQRSQQYHMCWTSTKE